MSLLWSVLLLGFIFYLTYKSVECIKINIWGPWPNAPPGPATYPFLGAIPTLLKDCWGSNAHKSPIDFFNKLHELYGEDFRLHNGTEDTIILSSLNGIREFSNHPNASFRPFNKVLMDMYSDGKDLGVGLGTGGERWRFLRRFSLSAFKSLSGGTQGLNNGIDFEVREILGDLKRRVNKSDEPYTLKHVNVYFDIPILNIIWWLVAGRRYTYGDPGIQKQFDYLKVFLEEPLMAPLTIIPFALHIPQLKRIYTGIREAMDSFRVLLSQIVEERRQQNFQEEKRGFIDLFLKAQLDDSDNPYLSNDDLIMCLQDFFLAGAETSSKTLATFVMYMVLYPEVQQRAADEIQNAIGKDTQIKSEHRYLLPYTDAVLMEVRRYATPFPITPFRCTDQNIIVNGFNVPANVPVQVNLNGVMRNKNCWKDPDVFNPCRFLNKEGEVEAPGAFMPFGFGKRRCIGEDIGNISNFLIVSNLLHDFKFRYFPFVPIILSSRIEYIQSLLLVPRRHTYHLTSGLEALYKAMNPLTS